MNDDSNRTLRFNRSSGLQRKDFERECRPAAGDVIVFAVVVAAIALILLGVI